MLSKLWLKSSTPFQMSNISHAATAQLQVSNVKEKYIQIKMFVYLYLVGLCFICIIPSSLSDICSTCLCSGTDSNTTVDGYPVINCHEKHLGSNDMLNFDLLMLDEHQRLNELILSKNNIIRLPPHLLKKLKRLKSLDLSGNLMEEIHTGDFTDLSNLEDLNFSRNMIRTFDDSLLKILPALLTLNLSYNHISTIDHTTEKRMGKINHLDLSHNNISNISSNFFESLSSLQYLDLSSNKIHSFEGDSLLHLNSLKILNINNNLLTSLQLQVFPKSLIELHFGFNSVTEILYEISEIQVLNMEYNRISELSTNLTMLNRLRSLNVSGNVLSKFPSIKLEKLETLDISSNKFDLIPETLSTEQFPMLHSLNVSTNPIREFKLHSGLRLVSFVASNIHSLETIDEDAFIKLEAPSNQCINLTISNNNVLSFIHEKALERMNICFLDLSNNHLTYIPPKLIALNTSFETYSIDLQGNPFDCNCSLQWMLDDLVPKLYTRHPELLDNLRCATPQQLMNMRMIHWYGWKNKVFCMDMSDFAEKLTLHVASVSSNKVITIDSSPGLLAVLGAATAVFMILVIIGLLLTSRQAMKRSRINRRF